MEVQNIDREWISCVVDNDYEINVNYPHQIRRKRNKRIVKESKDKDDYLHVHMNGKRYIKHRVIAIQFIPNPDNLPCVDHVNHIRTDNRIENMRWVTVKQNDNNKSTTKSGRKIEIVQDLPQNSVVIEQYASRNKTYEFTGTYLHGELFYVDTGNNDYRIVPTYSANGWRVACLTDKFGIQRTIYYDKILRQYGLD